VVDPYVEFKSNVVSARMLYSYDSTTWYELPTDYVLVSQYADAPLMIKVPDDEDTAALVAAAKGWALRLVAEDAAEPVVIRGFQVVQTTVQESFTDVNHSPTELVTQQTFIDPGSASGGMAVRCAGLFEQRLVLAGAADAPFRLWMSEAGNIDMWYASRPVVDTDPFLITIPAVRAAAIKHVVSARHLLVFTEGGVYAVDGTSEGFSYRTAQLKEAGGVGACEVEPVNLGSTVLYVGSDKREVLHLKYDLATDGMQTLERSVLAEHLTEESGIAKMVYQRSPESVVWMLLEDGSLLSFTIQDEHQVYAWAQHELGGVDEILDLVAPGHVEEGAGIVSSGVVYALVAAGDKELLVRLRPGASGVNPLVSKAAALDLCQAVTLAAAGLSLVPDVALAENESVRAVDASLGLFYDGTVQADGSVLFTAELPAGEYLVGYPVEAVVETLRPELANRNIQGLFKCIKDSLVRCARSGGISLAPAVNGQALYASGDAVTVAGGRYEFEESFDFKVLAGGHCNQDGRLRIVSGDHLPCEVLEVVSRIEVEG